PALLAVFVFWQLKEPEKWRQAAAQYTLADRLRAYFWEIIGNSRWARNALIGLLLASSGIVGLWAIGFFSIDLLRTVFEKRFTEAGLEGRELTFHVDVWAGWTSVMMNV